MRRALRDVNVLLALLDGDHIDQVRARDWLDTEIGTGWASCPITENGLVRIISQPRYPKPRLAYGGDDASSPLTAPCP